MMFCIRCAKCARPVDRQTITDRLPELGGLWAVTAECHGEVESHLVDFRKINPREIVDVTAFGRTLNVINPASSRPALLH